MSFLKDWFEENKATSEELLKAMNSFEVFTQSGLNTDEDIIRQQLKRDYERKKLSKMETAIDKISPQSGTVNPFKSLRPSKSIRELVGSPFNVGGPLAGTARPIVEPPDENLLKELMGMDPSNHDLVTAIGMANAAMVTGNKVELISEKKEMVESFLKLQIQSIVWNHHLMTKINAEIFKFNENHYHVMNPGYNLTARVGGMGVGDEQYSLKFEIIREGGLMEKSLFFHMKNYLIADFSERRASEEVTALLVEVLVAFMGNGLFRLVSEDESL